MKWLSQPKPINVIIPQRADALHPFEKFLDARAREKQGVYRTHNSVCHFRIATCSNDCRRSALQIIQLPCVKSTRAGGSQIDV